MKTLILIYYIHLEFMKTLILMTATLQAENEVSGCVYIFCLAPAHYLI